MALLACDEKYVWPSSANYIKRISKNKFQNIFVNAGGVLGDNLGYSKIKRCFEDIVQTI